MQVLHHHSNESGVFYVEENGEKVAEMTYTHKNGKPMVIDHTEVDKRLRGNNIGFELVSSSVKYAREHGFKIIPECSFAKAMFEKHKEFADVLK